MSSWLQRVPFHSTNTSEYCRRIYLTLQVSRLQGALVQWLKLPAWKIGNRGFEPHAGLQASKKQKVSSPLIRNDSILWGTSVIERSRARLQTIRTRILNPVPRGQCHLIYNTILRSFFWASLAYMCTTVDQKPHSFHFICK